MNSRKRFEAAWERKSKDKYLDFEECAWQFWQAAKRDDLARIDKLEKINSQHEQSGKAAKEKIRKLELLCSGHEKMLENIYRGR